MTILSIRMRAVGLFYRSVAPFMVGVSALVLGALLWPALLEGRATGLVPLLLLVKLATGPVVWYLSERMRPHQYWLYYNLGASRLFLWSRVVLLDAFLFLGAVLLLEAMYAL